VSATSETEFRDLLAAGIHLGQQKRLQEAVETLLRAKDLRPDIADTYFNLGVALRSQNRLREALEAFQSCVERRADWPEAHFNLANAYRDDGRKDLAIAHYEKAIALRAGYLKALNNLGNSYLDQGNVPQAETVLRQAVNIKPDYAEALFNLGRVLRRLRKNKEAFEVVSKAAALQPGNARYQLKLAELQKLTGQGQAAAQTLEGVLRTDPENPKAAMQLATMLREQNKNEDAAALLDRVVFKRRHSADVLWLRADIRRVLQRYDDAIDDLQHALALDPNSANAHNLLGVARLAKGEPEAAIECYERALQFKPDLVEAHNNLGAALQAIRRYSESRAAFDSALRLKPDFAVARLNRSLSVLRDGEFAEGWREFEWRFLCQDYRLGGIHRPTWMGERLDGKTIVLRSEQGLGDTFQFIRYARMVKERGARVIVECQDAACDLVSRCAGVDQVVKHGTPLSHADVQIPLMSLPNAFGTTLESIPAEVPYLAAEPALIEQWKKRLAPLGKVVVGIAWQGNKKFQADHLRSLPLSNFQQLSNVEGVALVSLQKNDGTEQLRQKVEFKVHEFTDELDKDGPFKDTSAIIAACDLIVTSDTAIAHLAGALGKPVWVALSYSADWRWLVDGENCPWYPTMRLFRQPAFKDWRSVFAQLSVELKQLVARDQSRLIPDRRMGGALSPKLQVETAPGELLDKLTILEIKEAHIADDSKLVNVRRELALLRATAEQGLAPSSRLTRHSQELRSINEQLWQIEDEIRECEREQDFGERFIELARSVYQTNDRRAAVKRQINEHLGSQLLEEKSYTDYSATGKAATPAVELCPEVYSPLARFMNGGFDSLTSYLLSARATVSQATYRHPVISESLENARRDGRPRVGIVIGHFDSPDFLELGLALLRKHCGDLPVLIADDCSPGSEGTPEGGFKRLIDLAAADGTARIWSSQQRFGNVAGDLAALAKALIWASESKLNVLVKLSQRLIIDH
jgi:tetratricopeptide (TPR) repeat protein